MLNSSRIKNIFGVCKSIEDKYPELLDDLNLLIALPTRGDQENPLSWCSKSTLKLTKTLNDKSYAITQRTVYK